MENTCSKRSPIFHWTGITYNELDVVPNLLSPMRQLIAFTSRVVWRQQTGSATLDGCHHLC